MRAKAELAMDVYFHQHPASRIQYLSASIILSLTLIACGMEGGTDSNPSNAGLQALAWTSPSQVDTGSGVAVGPLVVREPDGGGTGLAIWVEKTDLDPFDNPIPNPVHHLYARPFTAGFWTSSDSGCPLGNPDVTGNDGICVIDTGSAEFGAWAPQVSMDDNGDAMVLWAQTACLANPTGGACNDYENGDRWVSNIYARRFSGPVGLKSWGAAEAIDTGDQVSCPTCVEIPAFNPSLAIEPDGGGTAMAVWEQFDAVTDCNPAVTGTQLCWRIYARRFSGGSWATPCPGAGCPIIDAGVGSAHKPKVRMNEAGDALAVFIQFANATCYTVPTDRFTAVSPFSCPHNRLFYRTYTASTNSWSAATDFTPATSFTSLYGCFDALVTSCTTNLWGDENWLDYGCNSPGEVAGSLDCDTNCDTGGTCDTQCDTIRTGPIDTNTCRTFSDCRLAMDRVSTSSATVVYKSMERALVPDPMTCSGDTGFSCLSPVDCDCDWDCDVNPNCEGGCDCWNVPDPADGTDTYQQIRIEAFGLSAGVTATLANFSYLGPAGSANCTSTNPSDGDDFRRILNCDLDNPTVAIVPDGVPAERIALYERSDGPSNPNRIYYNRFTGGAWGASTFLAGSLANPAMAPQIVMDNAGNALAVWVQSDGTKNRIYSRYFSGGVWATPCPGAGCPIIDNNIGPEGHYYNPVVSMDGPGSALALFIGWTEGFGMSLYGVTGP